MDTKRIRPSALPKLAECPCYESEPVAGPAAERGTRIDAAARDVISEGISVDEACRRHEIDEPEDHDAVLWLYDTCVALAGGNELTADEESLRVECLNMTGTGDVACFSAAWSGDFKTGEIRNYREQQAAYAYGYMKDNGVNAWTVYLLYCDHQRVERLEFDLWEAEALLLDLIARALDENRVPTPCQYCGWCAKRFYCEPYLLQAAPLIPVLEQGDQAFQELLSDHERTRDFLLAAKVVDELAAAAREKVTRDLVASKASGEDLKIPGVSLVSKRGTRLVDMTQCADMIEQLSPEQVAKLLGKLSMKKAEEAFAEMDAEIPGEAISEAPGSSYIRVSKPKNK